MAKGDWLLREYRSSDLARLKELHAKQGFAYPFPDLDDPTFVVGAVAECNGLVESAAFLRVTSEAFFLQDGQAGTPRERWQKLLGLHEAVKGQARELGLCDVQCWIPPELAPPRNMELGSRCERGFVRRLKKLGWREDPWRHLSYFLR